MGENGPAVDTRYFAKSTTTYPPLTQPEEKVHFEVIPIGAQVIVGDDIPGRVSAICIREAGYIQYEVEYWDGRSRYEAWFGASTVRAVNDDWRAKIGFRKGEK